ncbi:glycoside hydrolase family 88 protein [Polaribacter sp.]|uniref:glycoside hydrolase family 88 protein n=1 Tax=Polaribacter sp. TaxID=1920175 RepID=UPI003F6D4A13
MKKSKIILSCFLLISFLSCKQKSKTNDTKKTEKSLLATVDNALNVAVKQYSYLSDQVEIGQYPRTFENDTLVTSNSGWWCSGFYPGTLLYLDEVLGAPKLKKEAISFLDDLKREQTNTDTHDLGFMMYCSFGNANRLEENKDYQTILMNSAKSLSTRYNDKVQAIRSWNSEPWNHAGEGDLVVIIDNMMNLELLFWASEYSGDDTYYNIAVNHAEKTLKNHFREDNSSYHQLIYDEKTGDVKAKITRQGAADSSAWARGQAWGLYGFTVMYRATKNQKYLDQAKRIADFILKHPNLPKNKIPYWDFNAPNIPNEERDSSAGAIIASALLELGTYTEGDLAKFYNTNAEEILTSLLTPEYFAAPKENGGFLLKHGVGDLPTHSEVNVPLSYGDYYLVEAMLRYKSLKK